jgi:polyphosphate glucokinase
MWAGQDCSEEEMAPARANVVASFIAALEPNETVIGGGNVTKLHALPPHSGTGDNDNAFRGGFRLRARSALLPPVETRSK